MKAKKAAKKITTKKASLKSVLYQAQSTITRRVIEAIECSSIQLRSVENYTIKLDRVLSDRHIKKLYNSLNKAEAKILIQLCTVMS